MFLILPSLFVSDNIATQARSQDLEKGGGLF